MLDKKKEEMAKEKKNDVKSAGSIRKITNNKKESDFKNKNI